MNDSIIKLRTQELLNKGRPEDAMNFIFNTYLEEHPEAKSLDLIRDKVSFKLKAEFQGNSPEETEQSKLLVNAFTTVIGHSEGETAFNLILFLLHLLHKGHDQAIREAIELIKLERASNNLNIAS